MTERFREVRRIVERYIVEVVEAFDLCPWARPARLAGELAIEVVAGTPAWPEWIDVATRMLATARVALVVAPELACTPAELRRMRDEVAAEMATTGVAEFHPDATYDDATPARLVPFLRRAPYPLLQFVPLAILDAVRSPAHATPIASQAQMLVGTAPAPRGDIADRLAADNHARVRARRAELEAKLAEILRDASTSR